MRRPFVAVALLLVLATTTGAPSASADLTYPPTTAANHHQQRPARDRQIRAGHMERVSRQAHRWKRVRYWREVRLRLKQQRVACSSAQGWYAHNTCLGRVELAKIGWSSQYGCLHSLWDRESHWFQGARNRWSGAGGIPQALPASKMSSAGGDWATNPRTQIRWGLGYIRARWGTPCAANAFQATHSWY